MNMNIRHAILFLAFVAARALDASAQDHLLPELGSLNDPGVAYEKSLREALFRDDAYQHYRARVICVPFGKPVWVVTLKCNQQDPPVYVVEYAVFETRPGAERKNEDTPVRRERATIDREAAEAIQGAWLRMLRSVRYPEVAIGGGADGVTYHFSRFVPRMGGDPLAPAGWQAGQIWTPRPGSPPALLASIGELMRDYTLVRQEERPKTRERMLKEAVSLNSDLDKARKPNE